MTHSYKPKGVCSNLIEIDLDGDIISDVRIHNGCSGSASGIVELIKGCKASDIVLKLHGIHCGQKSTSCPDQLSIALGQALNKAQ